MEFEVNSLLPSTHDSYMMWNEGWIDSVDQCGIVYFAGLEEW